MLGIYIYIYKYNSGRLFIIAIDPLLAYLERTLQGIPICSLPTLVQNPAPGISPGFTPTPYYTIRKVINNTPLNPIRMTVKQWYTYLLESKVTMRKIDQEVRTEKIPCKVEQRDPAVLWDES